MKILFDDKVIGATISSLNASANYPGRNVKDGFLRVRYQVDTTSDVLSITFDDNTPINCLYFGYTGNLTDITVSLYSGGILQTVALGAVHEVSSGGPIRIFETGVIKHFGAGPVDYYEDYDGEQFTSRHFDTVQADEIVFQFTGVNPFYIGGIGAGLAEDMPPAVAAWEDSYEDLSVVTRSPHGQTQVNYIEPTDRFVFSFADVSFTEFYTIKEAARDAGRRPVWVTFFEDSETTFPPGYFSVTMEGQQRERLAYDFTMTFEEAR